MAKAASKASKVLSNAEIATGLLEVARSFGASAENRYKVRAYQKVAESIPYLASSLAEEVRTGGDLTRHEGIGKGIAAAIRTLVESGKAPAPATASSAKSKRGRKVDPRPEGEAAQVLLYDADILSARVQKFLTERCGCTRVAEAGELRRRVEIVGELAYVVEADDFEHVQEAFAQFGGGAEILEKDPSHAVFRIGAGLRVRLTRSVSEIWGLSEILATGSPAHLKLLQAGGRLSRLLRSKTGYPEESVAYRALGLQYIPPELREGGDELDLARKKRPLRLVEVADIRGELHAHTKSSDGAHTIMQMAAAAKEKGYEYLGITDHSQSLKIAGGVSESDLWKQIRAIDKVNKKGKEVRILKSAEVDILADGSLDYPDALLAELDYTVCSIHSRFALSKEKQTERILRAMDNPYFDILGHSTGRLLLRRPGYEIDLPRVIRHAKARGCCFEINCSPDRLDLSSEAAALVAEAGIPIAILTDAHRIQELDWTRNGIDVARRAGLTAKQVLNALSLEELLKHFQRKR